MCLLRAVKHDIKYTNIPLGVFKHVFGKDQAIETLEQIVLAVPLDRGEKRLGTGSRRDGVNYRRSGRVIENHLKTGLFAERPDNDGAGRDASIGQVSRERHPTQFSLTGEIKGKCISALIWKGHWANSQTEKGAAGARPQRRGSP